MNNDQHNRRDDNRPAGEPIWSDPAPAVTGLVDAMIDIESLGTAPGAAILSIGALMVGPAGLGREFYAPVLLQSCTNAGLTIDPNAIAWWMQQSDAARAAAFRDDAEALAVVLYRFTTWFTEVGAERPWCHGATFDVPLLDAAYKACGMTPPWKFWHVRDTRTLYDLAGVKVDRAHGTHHNALDDARAQAEAAVKALNILNPEGGRFAWAVLAENGNIIIWSRRRDQVEPHAEKYGRPVVPVVVLSPGPTPAAPVVAVDWSECERIADLSAVDEALRGFSEDPTGDNGTMIVRVVLESIAAPEAAHANASRDAALLKINGIRNSIIRLQNLNWSEHVYPLVAALDEAGYEGMEYPEARAYYGTVLERAVKAEYALAAVMPSAVSVQHHFACERKSYNPLCAGCVAESAVAPSAAPGKAANADGLDLPDVDNTAKEALRDLSHVENHLEQSGAPTAIKNRAVDVRLCIKELRAALKGQAGAADPKDAMQTQAARDVLTERRRQVEAEGMTNEGDDRYHAAELPRAAASYILNGANDEASYIWPWAKSWWKPRDARANYVRAAALLLAEIERIDRAAITASKDGA